MIKGLLLVAGMLIGGASVNNRNLQEPQFECLDYFVEHMDDYNDYRVDNGYYPTNIDYIKSVPIITVDGDTIEGKLLKFDEGFLLFGEDEMIHSESFVNDIHIRRQGNLKFYDIGGFLQYNALTQEWYPLHQEYIDTGTASIESLNPSNYDGQQYAGEGTIYDIDSFVLDRYGTWPLYQSKKIETVDGYYAMYDCRADSGQYIIAVDDDSYANEDSGGLVVANIISDFIINYSSVNSGRALAFSYDCEVNEPNYYSTMMNSGFSLTNNLLTLLQKRIRQHAYDMYETLEFYTKEQDMALINWAVDYYNQTFTTTSTNSWTSMYTMTSTFKSTLDLNRIMMVDVSDSTTYASLVGVATGYRHYRKISLIMGQPVIRQAFFLEFRDTYDNGLNWLDITWPGIKCKTITMIA